MFTGIIENKAIVKSVIEEGSNKHFTFSSGITEELKIDQSVAHNGVCLTVVKVDSAEYTVTAIKETLEKTNLNELRIGDGVNLERCMKADGRFDGHMVYGHVDCVGRCITRVEQGGSTVFTFRFPKGFGIVVEKGSICLNGISLTVFDVTEDMFSVAIIPYTLEHTNLNTIEEGSTINLEFDILGKYISQILDKTPA